MTDKVESIPFLEVKDQGFVWHVPLMVIAENRADHYADDPDTTRAEEIEYAMAGNGEEACDWYLNNMNFKDVAKFAVLVEVPERKTKPGRDATVDVVSLASARDAV